MRNSRRALWFFVAVLTIFQPTPTRAQMKNEGETQNLTAKIRRFAPTVITADVRQLSANDRKALDKIIAAAKLFDPLFIRQVWSGNAALEKTLTALSSAPAP